MMGRMGIIIFNKDRLIPYGLTKQGKVVFPEKAQKLDTYYCPECGQELVLRSGKKAIYFAHKSRGKCRIQRSRQMRALLLLQLVLRHWLYHKAPPPDLLICCNRCGSFRFKPISNEISAFKRGYRISQKQKADIALLDNEGKLLTAINIKDDSQKNSYVSRGIPWLELSVQELLTDPFRWTPLKPSQEYLPIARCNCPQYEQPELELEFPESS